MPTNATPAPSGAGATNSVQLGPPLVPAPPSDAARVAEIDRNLARTNPVCETFSRETVAFLRDQLRAADARVKSLAAELERAREALRACVEDATAPDATAGLSAPVLARASAALAARPEGTTTEERS